MKSLIGRKMPLDLGLSEAQKAQLQRYEALVLKWQKHINLIAPSTAPHIRKRHIEDSLGFVAALQNAPINTLADLGSGAGFPALVIAICRPDIQVQIIESDERKAIFMETVSRETMLHNVSVYNNRIEAGLDVLAGVDIVTARALAPLGVLLKYMVDSGNAQLKGLFAKGAQIQDEIAQAQALYNFQFDILTNQGNPDSSFVLVSAVSAKA